MAYIDLEKIKETKPIEELLKFSILNIDKPSGPTSFQVSQYVKNALNLNKTSHLGTLDPKVSGVLPILLGRACRLSDYFMHKEKKYVGIMRLHSDMQISLLKEKVKKFIGKISQLPPVRSRVKRELREREIKTFEILETNKKDVLFETEVEAGTYIRKLVHDIGLEIGGAHMLELRRTKASIFTEEKLYTLYELEKAIENYKKGDPSLLKQMITPAEIISEIMPVVQLIENKNLLKKVLTGKPLFKEDLEINISSLKTNENFCLFKEDIFIGVYKKVSEKEIIARPEFVFN